MEPGTSWRDGDSDEGPRNPGTQRFPRSARIRRGPEIIRLHRSGLRRRRGPLDLFVARDASMAAAPGVPSGPRLGIVVPRHRHSVVERNLLRRRLREIGRRDLLPGLRNCGAGYDVLVRARPEAYTATFAELRRVLVRFTEELCSGELPSV